MKALVAGGTGFLGGAIVDAALAAGWEVSVLARGVTPRTPAGPVRVITADRYECVDDLTHERFDCVFDTSGFTPASVETLLDAVGPDIGRYVFVSSVSVYGDYSRPGLSEDAAGPTATAADFEAADAVPDQSRASAFAYGASHGPLKRACEIVATERLGERATLLRSGLLVGAGDYSDRLTWWVRRLDEGGVVAAPAPKDRLVQMIDVRDAAAFALRAAEQALSGPYNTTGRPISLGDIFDAIIEIAGSDAELRWVDLQRFLDRGVEPWSELPLVLPDAPAVRHFLEISTDKAERAGLTTRPLSATLADLLAWDRNRRGEELKCGISADLERAVLSASAELS